MQEFLRIKRVEFEQFPERYIRMAESLMLDEDSLRRAVPHKTLLDWQSRIESMTMNATICDSDAIYLKTITRIKDILSCMKPSLIDQQSFDSLQEPMRSRLSVLQPDRFGLHTPVSYSNSGSVTGRLTVASGPNFLTMPAEYKKLLKSKFDGGKILQIDMIAAEPTVALNIADRPPSSDPYLELAESVFEFKLDRNACKRVVLCALYGQSKRKISDALGSEIDASKAIRSTKDYFDYDRLIAKIRGDIDERNVMRNFFGRPIPLPDSSESLLVSYFLQSTAAEAAILAFGDLLDRTADYCTPLHIVHDALLIDCKRDYADFLIKKGNIKLKCNDWQLPAKVTVVSR
jgi:hypothetical protein